MQTMSTEKTTTLSIVVGVAALLAEIIFRNTFSSSTIGVILSVVLALVILCCTYLVVDGLQNCASVARKKEENRKREYDEKLYRLLNKRLSEIVRLQKEALGEKVYRDVEDTGSENIPDANQEFLEGQLDASILEMFVDNESKSGSAPSPELQPAVISIDNSERDRLLESINENIMKSAKFIVKYNKKNQEQAQELTEKSVEDLLQAVKLVEREIQTLGEQLSNLSISAAMPEGDRINELFVGGVMSEDSILPKENELSDLFITEESEAMEEAEDLDKLQDDITADLLLARQEIQSEDNSLFVGGDTPETDYVESDDILREILQEAKVLEENQPGPDESTEAFREIPLIPDEGIEVSEEIPVIADESAEVSGEIPLIPDEGIEVSEEIPLIADESIEVSEEIPLIPAEMTEESEEPEEQTEETAETPQVEMPQEALEPPVENLTAVDLLRIKQKEREEQQAKQQEAQEIEEEALIPDKVEVPASDDSNGIMSAEDIAALFASNNAES